MVKGCTQYNADKMFTFDHDLINVTESKNTEFYNDIDSETAFNCGSVMSGRHPIHLKRSISGLTLIWGMRLVHTVSS